MKFLRYLEQNQPTWALQHDEKIFSLTDFLGKEGVARESQQAQLATLAGIARLGEQRLGEIVTPTPVTVSDDAWLAPIALPQKIICVGLNYRDHAIETGKQPPEEPVIFSKLPSAVIPHHAAICLPPQSDQVDYEAELVVVIGQRCRRVEKQSAMDFVFGYCCGHDVSSRDWQYHHSGGQWLLGKSFDTFAPLGPYLVPKSQIPDPGKLRVQMRINGEVLQDSSTNELIFDIPHLVSYLSQIFTLEPGDLIFTGTPAGVGVARSPQRFLKPGDTCEVEIEGLGTLINPVV
jgi:2-keto-4-pentenoate hydratase/2-oxohepta-3-ene-1,7-dioic acid hydratase in catechol pathway